MINIQIISPPIKMPGLSSAIVSFSWSQIIVDALHTVSGAVYHPKYKLWEVPLSSLAELLDTLTFIDEIQLTINEQHEIEQISEPPLTLDEIKEFKYKPYNHQIEAINYGLCNKHKWLLLDTMGLG